MRLRFMGILTAAGLSLTATSAAAATCESLASLHRPAMTIAIAQSVPAGSFTPPKARPIASLPAFCRVVGVLKPSGDSEINFEVWLPAANWNTKFQGVGNGGFAGSIGYEEMAAALRRGFATASTDTGHSGTATDAKWALGHHEKIVDFGYRALHETTAAAKAISGAFYGDAPQRSYFSSCSNGGREALMEAQRYPADYDGIVAGAPAYFWTHLLTTAAWDMNAVNDPAAYIPAAKLPAIEAAALEACDALDGVKDGVIDNPARCHFDPAVLQCKDADSNTCLTAPQVAALKKIYSGPVNSKGEHVFPGFSPGGAPGITGWVGWVTGMSPGQSLQYAFGSNFFRYMVFDDANWDFKNFNVDRDTKVADDKMAGILNATDPDLKRFKDRGGRLIIYHGWSDAAIPPTSSIDYYQSVAAKMGAKQTADFVRLFMVPGMQHCGGGPGPNVFGQTSAPEGDAQHDVNRALEHWVEDGVAPSQIIAAKYKGATPSSGVARTRPLCAYPQVAEWTGSGSTDEAANFVCAAPKARAGGKR